MTIFKRKMRNLRLNLIYLSFFVQYIKSIARSYIYSFDFSFWYKNCLVTMHIGARAYRDHFDIKLTTFQNIL